MFDISCNILYNNIVMMKFFELCLLEFSISIADVRTYVTLDDVGTYVTLDDVGTYVTLADVGTYVTLADDDVGAYVT